MSHSPLVSTWSTAPLNLSFDAPVLMVVDWVDAIRQLRSDEAHAKDRWQSFMDQASALIDGHGGGCTMRVYGNGMLVAMDDAVQAAELARTLHQLARNGNTGHRPSQQLELRIGLHRQESGNADLTPDGPPAQMATQLCLLARPTETWASDTVRDGLTDGLDGQLREMGPCPSTNPLSPSRPQRAYRLLPPMASSAVEARTPGVQQPALAIVPFALRMGGKDDLVLGDIVADALNHQFGGDSNWLTISRLSTAPLNGRPVNNELMRNSLRATHAITGSLSRSGSLLSMTWQLTDLRTHVPIAGDSLVVALEDLLDPSAQGLDRLVDTIAATLGLIRRPVPRTTLPTIAGQCSLLHAVPRLFRAVPEEFVRGRLQLRWLAQRHPEAGAPHAWLALWHTLAGLQAGPSDRRPHAFIGQDCAAVALQRSPLAPFALAVDGLVRLLSGADPMAMAPSVDAALALHPNESLAWLVRGALDGLRGDPEAGMRSHAAACARSPLDPLRWLFDALGADLLLRLSRHREARQLARRSIRSQARQALSWRILTICYAETGRFDAARASLRGLLSMRPELTLRLDEAEHRADPDRDRQGRALRQAGLRPG